MVKLEKSEIHKMGNFFYITIPKKLIDTQILELGKPYFVNLTEVLNLEATK